MKEIKVPACVDRLDEVIEFVQACLEEAGCPMKAQFAFEVAVEEMFVNIAHYAYVGASEEAACDAVVQVEALPEGGARVTFVDGGKPFDPLAKADPDVTLSAAEREVGGLGIFMVKKSMDAVHYRREDGKNIFSMEKKF